MLRRAFIYQTLKRPTPTIEVLNPADVSGLKIWIDASDQSTVTQSSGNVTQINDKSGLGNNLTPFGGLPPQYFNTGGSNNLPYINFSSNKNVYCFLAQAVPFTIYFVARQNNFVNGNHLLQIGPTFPTGLIQKTSTEGLNALTIMNGDNWREFTPGTYNNRFTVFRFSVTSAGTFNISTDDEPVIGTDTRFKYGNVGTMAIDRIVLGNSTSSFDFQELVVLSNIPSAEDDIKLKNYFFQKYQPLRSGIPYYSFGDSITASGGYVGAVPALFGAISYNYGASGSDIGYPTVSADSLDALLSTVDARKPGYLTFCYGTNSSPSPDIAWKTLYKSKIQSFITRGFDPNKICIITPPYQSNKVAKMALYNQWIYEISQELGIRFADCWSYMEVNGGDSNLLDGTHPSETGYTHMRTVITAAYS